MKSFLVLLLAFCFFYKAPDACFLLKIARDYSLKRQATSAFLKNQNTISPNDLIGLKCQPFLGEVTVFAKTALDLVQFLRKSALYLVQHHEILVSLHSY